jgi:hypothetical protein
MVELLLGNAPLDDGLRRGVLELEGERDLARRFARLFDFTRRPLAGRTGNEETVAGRLAVGGRVAGVAPDGVRSAAIGGGASAAERIPRPTVRPRAAPRGAVS